MFILDFCIIISYVQTYIHTYIHQWTVSLHADCRHYSPMPPNNSRFFTFDTHAQRLQVEATTSNTAEQHRPLAELEKKKQQLVSVCTHPLLEQNCYFGFALMCNANNIAELRKEVPHTTLRSIHILVCISKLNVTPVIIKYPPPPPTPYT